MNRDNNQQLELFSQEERSSESPDPSFRSSFLKRIRQHEKILLCVIGFIISCIISFSLGVEKGKQLSVSRLDSTRLDYALKEQKQQPQYQQQRILAPQPAKEEVIMQSQRLNKQLQNYTIQLASYKTKGVALKEADNLKRKGFSPLVLTKGSYSVLCVGKYPDKETAQGMLSELRRRYQDCIIRRL